jgi:adenosylcobinamide amidohydrolase
MNAAHAHATAPLGPAPSLEANGRLLVVRFGAPHETLSWAIWNGGRRTADAVGWWYVHQGELGREVDPRALLAGVLDIRTVGLLTARDVSTFEEVILVEEALAVRCVATCGLGNALSAGDPAGPFRPVGTINLLCQVSLPLAEEAMLETLALAAEARTAAVLEAHVPSRVSGRDATGTGTDCIVIASPPGAVRERYAGKHTSLGALVGRAVRTATERGVARWLAELRG